jgi:hypothetical protein
MTVSYQEVPVYTGEKILQRTDEDGKVWTIPTDPANSDYQAYLASLEAPQA